MRIDSPGVTLVLLIEMTEICGPAASAGMARRVLASDETVAIANSLNLLSTSQPQILGTSAIGLQDPELKCKGVLFSRRFETRKD
jgi:hypothetical protein